MACDDPAQPIKEYKIWREKEEKGWEEKEEERQIWKEKVNRGKKVRWESKKSKAEALSPCGFNYLIIIRIIVMIEKKTKKI